jgi:hypothetical protein
VLAAAGLALVARAFLRLRRRGRTDLASPGSGLLCLLGVAVITLALESSLDPIGEDYPLSAHIRRLTSRIRRFGRVGGRRRLAVDSALLNVLASEGGAR